MTLADPEIAAATFQLHLDKLWQSGRPEKMGWERRELDRMHTLVRLPATRPTGEVDHYLFRLGADYYDAAPPTVALVTDDGQTYAPQPSIWYPVIENPPWFGLHAAYQFPDAGQRQLVCFSFAAEYYLTNHSPNETERWQQGRHTVAATLFRLSEVLSPRYYRRPSQ